MSTSTLAYRCASRIGENMVGIFYLISIIFLSLLPILNGYAYISLIFAVLALISPLRTLLAQWCVLLTWLIVAHYSVGQNRSYYEMPDEYYLYLLHAVVFVVNIHFYKSHIKQLRIYWIRLFLVAVRYGLFLFAAGLFITVFFRTYPISNLIWAMLCIVYACYLPKRESPTPISIVSGYVILFIMLTITTLGLLEIGVRLFFVSPQESSGFYMPHAEAIFTFRPNSQDHVVLNDNDDKTISPVVTVSSQGVRDHEYGPKSDNDYRIVMLGDSFTMGHGLEPEETIDSVLECLFNEDNTGHNIQVINCGVGAYAPWQERIFLQERGFAFEPDLVILQLYPANDVAGSYNKVEKYLRAIDITWEYILLDYRRQNTLPSRIERWSKQYSSAYRLMLAITNCSGVLRPLVNKCRLFQPTVYPHVIQRSERDYNEEVCLVDWYPELEEAWGIYRDTILGIRNDCMERGIDLIAYAHGNSLSLRPDVWEALNKKFCETPYEMNKDIRITNELLAELNIPYVDVLSTLTDYSYEEIYFIHDGHFTPKGAVVIARCLRDYLINNNLIN